MNDRCAKPGLDHGADRLDDPSIKDAGEVTKAFGANLENGLALPEASRRLLQDGLNELHALTASRRGCSKSPCAIGFATVGRYAHAWCRRQTRLVTVDCRNA